MFEQLAVAKGVERYKNASKNFMDIAVMACANFFSSKPMFEKQNFKFYYYDNYVTGLNTINNNFMTLFIEIDQPKNEKTISPTNKKVKKFKNEYIKDRYLTLFDIKAGLFEEFKNLLGGNCLLWKTPYYIEISCVDYYKQEQINYYFRVVPCFTIKNKLGNKGVIYYPKNMKDAIIEYPELSLKNIKKKNDDTDGLYKDFVLIFKNLFKKSKPSVQTLPFEMFESALYNVPNDMFKALDNNSAMHIINYLRNKPMNEFITIDEQDKLFYNKNRVFNYTYFKYMLREISNQISFK